MSTLMPRSGIPVICSRATLSCDSSYYHFDFDARFPPFLLYVRWKSGVTFVWRCFRDEPGCSVRAWTFRFGNWKVYNALAVNDSSSDQPACTRVQLIRITRPCDLYPLTPHFYIVKLGFTGVCIIFLFLL